MQIGELAKQTGVNVQTVRFYERRGLLEEAPRKESGYRVYTDADVRRLRFIMHAKSLGFTLDEIKSIQAARKRGECPCSGVLATAERHLLEVEKQIVRLERFREELARAIHGWKRSRKRTLPADSICVLIERTMPQGETSNET